MFDAMDSPLSEKEKAIVAASRTPQSPTPEAQPLLPTKDASLLACPFCGNDPNISFIGGVWVVGCSYHGCLVTVHIALGDREAAVSAWNTRAQSTPPEQRSVSGHNTLQEPVRSGGQIEHTPPEADQLGEVNELVTAHPEAVRMPPLDESIRKSIEELSSHLKVQLADIVAVRYLVANNILCGIDQRERELLAALTELQTERAAHERTSKRLDRLTNPRIYVGKYYASAEVPERCPDCDSRDFISHGTTGIVCKSCWLTAELDKAEAELESLRSENERLRLEQSQG